MHRLKASLALLLTLMLLLPAATGSAAPLVQVATATEAPSATLAPKGDQTFEQWLTSLALIDQRNMRYYEVDRLIYKDQNFNWTGCGPGAVANGLITVLGIDDWKVGDDLLAEVIQMFRDVPYDSSYEITVDHVRRLTNGEGDRFATWKGLKDSFPGQMASTGDVITIPQAEAEVNKLRNANGPALFFCRVRIENQLANLVDYCHRLYAAGEKDALLVAFYLQGGNREAGGPFHTGGGHYVTVAIHVATFEEEGRIYVEDAFPRAATRAEAEDTESWYGNIFPFVDYSAKHPFNKTWSVHRLSRILLRLTLKDAALYDPSAHFSDTAARSALLDSQTAALETLQLTSAGGFAILLP